MLFHINVDKRWWAKAINTAVFITNRLSCDSYPKKTPFELIFGQNPDILGIVKLDKKAFKCIFLQREEITCLEYRLGTCDVYDVCNLR
ncbi:hypothetical protein PsorP6_001032 [Peronosclerospora sorghi]|uniref:Uncharacterized protein n=1 Tax=Peronosclerospora sorghi TaxID=230839 RepID=A0ACC0WPF3_9STRA|nr:hypothetical protein PsorP6_001032 [Peronosclerospora sorghi]